MDYFPGACPVFICHFETRIEPWTLSNMSLKRQFMISDTVIAKNSNSMPSRSAVIMINMLCLVSNRPILQI